MERKEIAVVRFDEWTVTLYEGGEASLWIRGSEHVADLRWDGIGLSWQDVPAECRPGGSIERILEACLRETLGLSAQDIIDALDPEDERALMEWARLASMNSIAAGGIGQTVQEMRKAREAWEALSPAAKRAHDALLALLAQEYEDAREEYRRACGEEPPESVLAVMGPDWPGFGFLSAQEIADIADIA